MTYASGVAAPRGEIDALPPILMYHSISDPSLPHAVDRDLFAAEIAHLASSGYQGISVAEALDRRPARRPIILTFDDGYQDNLESALPILQRHGFRATVFVVTDFVDSGQTPWRHASLSWSECRDLRQAGIEIGSHTRSHPDLRLLDPDRLEDEVSGSKSHIEDRLGAQVDSFAYPFGYLDAGARNAVQAAGYRAGCAVRLPRRMAAGRYTLVRVGITRNDSLARFRVKISPAYRAFLRFRLDERLSLRR